VIEFLAGAGGITTALLVPALVWVVYKLVRGKDEQITVLGMLDQEREHLRESRSALARSKSELDATKAELNAERKLRSSVEQERDDAVTRSRTNLTNLIAGLEKAGVADAIRVVDDLLAGMQDEHTVPAGDPDRTDDDLLSP